MGKYVFTVQLRGNGLGPMEAWENAKENFFDEPLEYDDVQDTYIEDSHEKAPDIIYYQPLIDSGGKVQGHDAYIFSCEIWKSKENLLETYPDCVVREIKHGEIELPIIVDE